MPTFLILGKGPAQLAALRDADSDPSLLTHERATDLLSYARRRGVDVIVDPRDPDEPLGELAYDAWIVLLPDAESADLDADEAVIAYCKLRSDPIPKVAS